jgi:type IV pilus assembly protein PilM
MTAKSKTERKPRLACEISPTRVLAARADDAGQRVDACAVRTLGTGDVAVGLTTCNLNNATAVENAIRETFAEVGARGRDVILILPDSCCRVSLIDLETLPPKKQDAEAVVRFRLKKALPFDVEKARISFQAQTMPDRSVRVLATVALTSVLDDYESAVRAAGYQPGIVVPSTLAALGSLDGATSTLVINVGAQTLTVAGVDNEQLLLFRTIENPQGVDLSGEQMADDVHASVVFFEDTYGARVERIMVSGVAAQRVAEALRTHTGVRAQDLVSASQIGTGASGMPAALLGPVVGALTA